MPTKFAQGRASSELRAKIESTFEQGGDDGGATPSQRRNSGQRGDGRGSNRRGCAVGLSAQTNAELAFVPVACQAFVFARVYRKGRRRAFRAPRSSSSRACA